MLYLFRYLPKKVTLDIFVLDNFMSYNDIPIVYLDYFCLRSRPTYPNVSNNILFVMSSICRKSWTIFVSEVNLTTGDEKLTPYRVRGTKNTLSN